jgi:phage recombination protein Bet
MTDPATEPDKSLATGKPKALAVMASRLNVDPQKLLQTLKETVFKGANDSELLTLVVVANEYGLSPLLREIYAFPAKGGGITPVVSIDGWISMVNRQPQLDGLEFEWVGEEVPESCTCTIYIKNRAHPVRVTEFYAECVRATEPWKQMPRRMLRHKALKEAARVAFGFSGVTDEDEARDIMKNADAHLVIERKPFPPPKRIEKPNLESQSDAPEAAAAEPVVTAKTERKGRTASKEEKLEESPQDRLAAALLAAKVEWAEFMTGLKLLYPKTYPFGTEVISDLPDDVCEGILAYGLSQTMRDINEIRGFKTGK